jgi:catalase
MPEEEKESLTTTLANAMKFGGVQEDVKKTMIDHFTKCDPDYGKRVKDKLGM